ncbi:MAG TPA: hypothetical protein VKB05_19955 [Pyrinomonadaceae bacterium]|nr:hypothetical protein [Pyrinomonadaceae bacterium]
MKTLDDRDELTVKQVSFQKRMVGADAVYDMTKSLAIKELPEAARAAFTTDTRF